MRPSSDGPAGGTLGLFVEYMRLSFKSSLAFPASLALEQLSYLVQLVLSIALWKYLFVRLPRLAGWTFDGILVLHLFGNLFIALFHSLFTGFHAFHTAIRRGTIDYFLCRPVDPRIGFLAQCLQPWEMWNRLLGLVPLVLFMYARGVHLEGARLAAGLAAMLLGLAAFACLQLAFTYVAFWIDRGDALLSFLDLFYGFYRFPLDALPLAAQLVITLVAPVLLAVTYPALYAAGLTSASTLWRAAAASLAMLALGFALEERLWKMGLATYQSPGG